jgi:hypothetical protein
VAIFNLLDGVTVYFVPIGKASAAFVKQMGITTDSSHLQSYTKKTVDFDQETHLYAWISHVRQTFAVRSNTIWNPTVLKNMPAEPTSVQPKPQIKYASPVTSEEPSYESAKQKKKVEINLIQAAEPVIKSEQ